MIENQGDLLELAAVPHLSRQRAASVLRNWMNKLRRARADELAPFGILLVTQSAWGYRSSSSTSEWLAAGAILRELLFALQPGEAAYGLVIREACSDSPHDPPTLTVEVLF